VKIGVFVGSQSSNGTGGQHRAFIASVVNNDDGSGAAVKGESVKSSRSDDRLGAQPQGFRLGSGGLGWAGSLPGDVMYRDLCPSFPRSTRYGRCPCEGGC
jgi:hypothetical protein